MKTVIRVTISAVLAFVVLLAASSARANDDKKGPKLTASAIQVKMIESSEVQLPMAFQLALYENLIEQLQKSAKFQHVYRDGDKAAADATDLVVLSSNVTGFKQGSEEARQVTTVAGATHIKVHCTFSDKGGKSELEQDVTGNVYFLGGNLRATYDFAKKVAQIVTEHF
jgi:hypothetical protein